MIYIIANGQNGFILARVKFWDRLRILFGGHIEVRAIESYPPIPWPILPPPAPLSNKIYGVNPSAPDGLKVPPPVKIPR